MKTTMQVVDAIREGAVIGGVILLTRVRPAGVCEVAWLRSAGRVERVQQMTFIDLLALVKEFS